MAKYVWVTVNYGGGRTEWYCVRGRVGRRCFSPTFLSRLQDEPDAGLDELTDAVNSAIGRFVDDHPNQELRILADTREEGDEESQLRFAFVGTDLEISLADRD